MIRLRLVAFTLGLLGSAGGLVSCGYHIEGHASLLPKDIKTVAVPAFTNTTTRYKLTDRLPEAISREFLARTKYRVVADPNQADAVLTGRVMQYTYYPILVDAANSRATTVEMHLTLQVTFTERATGKVLFTRPSFEMRDRYEISEDPTQYFEESASGLDRIAKQAAAQVVSGILSNF